MRAKAAKTRSQTASSKTRSDLNAFTGPDAGSAAIDLAEEGLAEEGLAIALGPLVLDGQGPVWLQIRRALAQPILRGAWPPGAKLPREIDLTVHFKTARMTVSRALQSLAHEGLVRRTRRVGTVVAARARDRPVFEIWDTADIIRREGCVYAYELLGAAVIETAGPLHLKLGVSEGAVLSLQCLHLADGTPFQYEDRLIHLPAAPKVTKNSFETTPPGPWLLSHVAWSAAEHAIAALEAGPIEAAALHVPIGAACLVVERRTWSFDAPVTFVRLWHSGLRHRLTGRFTPLSEGP